MLRLELKFSESPIKIMGVNEDNVWNGGPEPSNLTEGTKSLGELCLKRLKEQGDVIKMVGHQNIYSFD